MWITTCSPLSDAMMTLAANSALFIQCKHQAVFEYAVHVELGAPPMKIVVITYLLDL